MTSLRRVSGEAANIWDEVPRWGGGLGTRRMLRPADGSLGASLWELEPGASQFVYHFHHATEELLIVLRGQPTVRMRDGERVLAEGDVLPFPAGAAGGHQIRNDGEVTARVLVVSASADPDVAEYPDSGKIAIVVGGRHHFHRVGDELEHAGPD